MFNNIAYYRLTHTFWAPTGKIWTKVPWKEFIKHKLINDYITRKRLEF